MDFDDSAWKNAEEQRPATMTQERCNLGYGKNMNPNFFGLFLDMK
jgi:hypothetical protein